MGYIVTSGLQRLVSYGWPGLARQDSRRCSLHSDRPVSIDPSETPTTDNDGHPAFYSLAYEGRPIVFHSWDAAQYTIDRFRIPEAKIVPWRGQ